MHDRLDRRLPDPVLLLLAAAAGSAALLLAWGSRLTFLLDEWEFLLQRPGFTAHSILTPHGEHISIAPILIYKALLATVGMSSSLPYLAVSVALFLATSILLFVYLRRRVDPWLALLATAIVLFLGPASEDLLWGFQMGFMGSLVCGLGALLLLERGDRRGDWLACALLTVGVTFSSLGLPFIVAACVDVALRGERLRRLYIVAVPAPSLRGLVGGLGAHRRYRALAPQRGEDAPLHSRRSRRGLRLAVRAGPGCERRRPRLGADPAAGGAGARRLAAAADGSGAAGAVDRARPPRHLLGAGRSQLQSRARTDR